MLAFWHEGFGSCLFCGTAPKSQTLQLLVVLKSLLNDWPYPKHLHNKYLRSLSCRIRHMAVRKTKVFAEDQDWERTSTCSYQLLIYFPCLLRPRHSAVIW